MKCGFDRVVLLINHAILALQMHYTISVTGPGNLEYNKTCVLLHPWPHYVSVPGEHGHRSGLAGVMTWRAARCIWHQEQLMLYCQMTLDRIRWCHQTMLRMMLL